MSQLSGGVRPFDLEQFRSSFCRFLHKKSHLWVSALDVDTETAAAKFLGSEWADRCDHHPGERLVQQACLLHSLSYLE